MRVGASTDTGMVRQLNEDCYYIPPNIDKDIHLFIVADGMGGHKAGEVASKIAIDTVVSYITAVYKDIAKDNPNLLRLLSESILKANKVVYERSKTDLRLEGMGTTLDVVLIDEGRLFIGHVGDSRVYVIRRNNIYQLTRDHSYVEQLVKSGTITREEANNHPQRNIITRALGTDEVVEIDVCVRRLFDNDRIVLCTDGLTNMVPDEQIKQMVVQLNSCQHTAEQLVMAANDAGGIDNVTVIVAYK